jgi:hypothetical protein
MRLSFLKSKKGIALLATLVVAASAAFGAYAYFTTSASGGGQATSGAPVSPIPMYQSGSVTGLEPGGSSANVEFSIPNTVGNGAGTGDVAFPDPASITIFSITVGGVDVDQNRGNGACNTDNFAITEPTTAPGEVDAGNTFTSSGTSGGSIKMVETHANQDACENATISLSFSAS